MKFRRLLKARSLIVVSAGLIAVFIAISGSTAASQAPGDGPLAYTSKFGHNSPLTTAGSPAQMLVAALRRYRGDRIVSGRIAAKPATPGLRPGIWLNFLVRVPDSDGRANRARWEVDVVVGALAEALAGVGHPGIAGVTIEGSLPDGSIVPDLAGGMGEVVSGQDFLDTSDASLKQDLAQRLAAANLKPVSIEIVRIDQAAPAVVAETSDPRAAAAAAAQTSASFFGPEGPAYEGYYLEVRDTAGNPVFIRSGAFRSGVARLWFSPSVADVISVAHK